MLDWERWILTHSSGAAVVLALFFEIGLGLGLVTTSAASAAAVAEVPEVPDGDADGDPDGEVVWLEVVWLEVVWLEVVWLGALLTLVRGDTAVVGGSVTLADWLAGGLGETEWLADGLVEGEGDGDGEGEGERDGDGDGDGDGVGVPDDGSAWHTLSVLAVVAVGAACAVPSTPRVRKLPLSKMTAAALGCAKRIRTPVYAARQGYRVLFVIRRRLGDGWVRVLIFPLTGYICITRPLHYPSSGSQPSRPGPRLAGFVYPRQHGYDGPRAGSVP